MNFFQELLKQKQIENLEQPEEQEDDLAAYNFNKFAATYFRKNVNPYYSKKVLKESLLELPTPDDVIAAQAIWITILRFTGDLPEPRFDMSSTVNDSVMTKLTETLNRGFTNRKEFQVSTCEENVNITAHSRSNNNTLRIVTYNFDSYYLSFITFYLQVKFITHMKRFVSLLGLTISCFNICLFINLLLTFQILLKLITQSF